MSRFLTAVRANVAAKVALGPLALVALVAGLALPQAASAAPIHNDPGCRTSTLPANDDSSTDQVPIGFPINFFGTTYRHLYVNNNGNVTFDRAQSTYTPFPLRETSRVIIAPFFADVDTRNPSSDLVKYGNITFFGRPTFCVNWAHETRGGVGYYDEHADKLNSFQLLIIDRSDVSPGAFDIVMNINRIRWETGDASGGTNGFGGNSARMGYSSGDGASSYEQPGSAVNGGLLDSNRRTGLIHNRRHSNVNGQYVFHVRGGAVTDPSTDAPPEGERIRGEQAFTIGTSNDLTLACTTRDLWLVDVLPYGSRRVYVTGVADPRLIGRTVYILLNGRPVGLTRIRSNGKFSLLVRAPSDRLRSRSRYQAALPGVRSQRLRLVRRMFATTLTRRGNWLLLRGRISGPFARSLDRIFVQRFRSCRRREWLGSTISRVSRSGAFIAAFRVPSDGARAAIYRAATRVALRPGGRAASPTYTLPRTIDLP